MAMPSRLEFRGIPADWAAHAVQWPNDLTPETPLSAECEGPAPYPLTIDVHQGIEFGIILAGSMNRLFTDTSHVVRPGDVWIAASWEPHGWSVEDPTTRSVVLIFLPEFLGDEMIDDVPWLSLISVAPSKRPRVTDDHTRATVLGIGWEMRNEVIARGRGWQAAVRLGLLRTLLALRRAADLPAESGDSQLVSGSSISRIMPAVDLLRSTPSRRIGLPHAAAACGLSVSQFSRLFRAAMGVSFGRFCLRSRVATASHLLLATSLPTEVIAERCGFADASHLSHAFIREYGIPPSSYRHSQGRVPPR
jgi:AraC-like DNA-binding protein